MYRWNKQSTVKNYKNFFAYTALGAALVSMALFGVCTPRQGRYIKGLSTNFSDIVAKVGSEKINFKEFYNTYQNAYEYYQRLYKGEFKASDIKLATMVLNELVSETINYIIAKQNGIAIGNEEIEDQIFETFKDEKGKFSGTYFENTLKSLGYTEGEYVKLLQKRLLQYKFLQFLQDTIEIPDFVAMIEYTLNNTKANLEYITLKPELLKINISQDQIDKFLSSEEGSKKVKDYYDSHTSEFKQPKKVNARHILISYQDARLAPSSVKGRTKEKARQIAQNVLQKVKANPQNFVNIAKEYTDEPEGKEKGGSLGYFAYEDMVKEFSDVAFKLKVGEISDIVETPFGFHIIKIEGIQEEKNINFDQAKNQIAKNLLEQEEKTKLINEKAQIILKELLEASTNVQAQNALLKKYDLKWEQTGEFDLRSTYIPKLGSIEQIRDILLSFKKLEDIYPNVLDIGNTKYIIKLKSLTYPQQDWNLLSQDKKEEFIMSLKQQYSNKLFVTFKKALFEELETKGKIWKDQKILNLDIVQTNNSES